MIDERTAAMLGVSLGLGRWRWYRRWVARCTGLVWARHEYRVAWVRRAAWLAHTAPVALGSGSLFDLGRKVVELEFWRGSDQRYVCLREGALGGREVLVDGTWREAAPWLLVWDREREERRKGAA